MSFPKNKINLEVLLYALSQQVDPLPPDLQRSLTEIGQASLAHPTDENKIELRELIKDYQPLETVYRDALTRWHQSYVAQERTKSLNATFPTMSGLDDLSIESFLPTNDWVKAAQELTNQLSSPQTPAKFWDKTDRMAVTTAGGIAIGSAIAQLPGAIVGGLLGAVYGWYVGFRKTVSQKSNRAKSENGNVIRQIVHGTLHTIALHNVAEHTVHAVSIHSHNVVLTDNNDPNLAIDFCDLPTEQLVMLAQSATKDAVKDLHHKGISTYGMRDGIIYETNPITDTQSVVEKDRQS